MLPAFSGTGFGWAVEKGRKEQIPRSFFGLSKEQCSPQSLPEQSKQSSPRPLTRPLLFHIPSISTAATLEVHSAVCFYIQSPTRLFFLPFIILVLHPDATRLRLKRVHATALACLHGRHDQIAALESRTTRQQRSKDLLDPPRTQALTSPRPTEPCCLSCFR